MYILIYSETNMTRYTFLNMLLGKTSDLLLGNNCFNYPTML